MTYRRHANKPTAALWALVALADIVLLLASGGLLLVVTTASVAAAVGFLAWRHLRGERALAGERTLT